MSIWQTDENEYKWTTSGIFKNADIALLPKFHDNSDAEYLSSKAFHFSGYIVERCQAQDWCWNGKNWIKSRHLSQKDFLSYLDIQFIYIDRYFLAATGWDKA